MPGRSHREPDDGHVHEHVHADDADWASEVARIELEGEVLLAFVTGTAAWITELRGPGAPPVRRILDVGSGPGVAACELARQFPEARIVAVDGSPAMLARATRRAAEQRLEARVATRLAELPDGIDELDGLEPAELIWTSMALHHTRDEPAALRVLHGLLDPSGLVAIVERAEPMRVLPDDLGLGRPGLGDRLAHAEERRFAATRAEAAGSARSTDLPSMLTAAGFETVGSRVARVDVEAPADAARRLVAGRLRRARDQLADTLDAEDVRTLAILTDPDDPRGVLHRADVFVRATRQVVIARPTGDGPG
jgi:ubiquinone/menaquinone biosynthesis C-methylase UbiE